MSKKKKNAYNPGFTLLNNDSPFAFSEAFNTLRTNFNFCVLNGQSKKIIITSSLQGEGKTSVAINLSISLASSNKKVLLIDADMRNPSVHRYIKYKRPANTGLSSVLLGMCSLEESTIHCSNGLDILYGGPVPPMPVEILSSSAMSTLLDQCSSKYDFIIFDTAPIGIVTDAAALSTFCDGTLYVIRQNYATKNQVRAAFKSLTAVDVNILGIIFNQYDIRKDSDNNYGYYRYDNYKQSSNYKYTDM